MKILSVNAGSSSLKFTLFEMPEEKELISGVFEKIGLKDSFYNIKINGEKTKVIADLPSHNEAFEILMKELVDNNIISDYSEIKGIGHRVAQGGSYFDKSVLATPENIDIVTKLSQIAPLHNPAAVIGINAAKKVVPDAVQTLVFDTSFHQTMPEVNYMYAVPYEWYTKYNVRKYGFHGTSHKYVTMKANEILGKTDTKLITCHIGNGASISAVLNGKCLDTSMGLTPNAGLMMGSRCGDIDASIVSYISECENLSVSDINTKLNKESGFLGISGVSSDARDIEDGIARGDERCILAQNMYVKKIVDYIASYYVELGGCDAIIFTAGLGENSVLLRKQVLEKLACLGVKIDEERNNVRGKETLITADNSKIPVYVIPTNEELMIATDTYNLTK